MSVKTIRRSLAVLLAAALSLPAWGSTFNIFGPVTGILKGSATSPITTAATWSDVTVLLTGTCNSSVFVRGDGSCVAVSLTSGVSGTLPVANGGTNLTAASDDNVMVGNGTTWQSKALTDCDSASSAVTYDVTTNAWGCNSITSVTGAALTKTDDTNVTLTLGGSPTTALVNAASITAGWTGTLAASRGGLGMSTVTDDTVAVANGTTWQSKALTDCDAVTSAVTYDTTTNAWGCNTINGATAANPTGTIGLSAVNGSAGTFLRSDGAPALSQAISPTMTGNWTFTPSSGQGASFTGTANNRPALFDSSTTTGQGFGPLVTAGTNASDEALKVRAAVTGNRDYLKILGTGATTFGNTTDNPTFTIAGTGAVSITGNTTVGGGASPRVRINGTSGNPLLGLDSSGTLTGYFCLSITASTCISGDSAGDVGVINRSGPIRFSNDNGSTSRVVVNSGVIVGAPTGGDQGSGTLNATGLYINGVSVAGGVTQTSTFTATLTGVSGTVTCTVKYRLTGSQVSLFVNSGGTCTGTSNATSLTFTGLPAAIQAASNATVMGVCTDNGGDVGCGIGVGATGTVTFYKDTGSALSATGWTASGSKGFTTGVFIYDLRN